jgi:hypothetical protein
MIPNSSGALVYLVTVALTMLSMCTSSLANYGRFVTSTITDKSGSEIPNAQIVIKDLATGISAVTTNKDGLYRRQSFVAEYQVTISPADSATK